MKPSPRVNYDIIAHLYDTQPYRDKTVDPELLAFLEQRRFADTLSILDIGCGTGNQLVANRAVVPQACLVGLDRSLGMLQQAQPKAPDIAWVQADGAGLPFQAESFDFVTCQYALHHIQDKAGMLRAVWRVLRHGGRVILHNLCPQECADWLYYTYFPEAHTIDLADFWPPEAVVAVLEATGFVAGAKGRPPPRFWQKFTGWRYTGRRPGTLSQLLAIPDAAFPPAGRRPH